MLFLGRMAAQVRRADVTQTQVVELMTSGRSGELGLSRRVIRSGRMSAQTDEIVEQDEPQGGKPEEGLAALGAYLPDLVPGWDDESLPDDGVSAFAANEGGQGRPPHVAQPGSWVRLQEVTGVGRGCAIAVDQYSYRWAGGGSGWAC